MKRKENSQGMGPKNPRRKLPGNGTQEPVNKQPGIGTSGPVEKCKVRVSTTDKQNLHTETETSGMRRTAQISSNLSSQCWARCTLPRTSRFSTRSNLSGKRKMKSEAARTPFGDKELEQVTCESDAKPDKNHELLRIESENGAKDREAETKATAATAVALNTKGPCSIRGPEFRPYRQHRCSERSHCCVTQRYDGRLEF